MNTPPGTKLLIAAETKIRRGKLLLTPDCVTVLGGMVSYMYEAWAANRDIYKKRRRNSGTGGASKTKQITAEGDPPGPPIFEPFAGDTRAMHLSSDARAPADTPAVTDTTTKRASTPPKPHSATNAKHSERAGHKHTHVIDKPARRGGSKHHDQPRGHRNNTAAATNDVPTLPQSVVQACNTNVPPIADTSSAAQQPARSSRGGRRGRGHDDGSAHVASAIAAIKLAAGSDSVMSVPTQGTASSSLSASASVFVPSSTQRHTTAGHIVHIERETATSMRYAVTDVADDDAALWGIPSLPSSAKVTATAHTGAFGASTAASTHRSTTSTASAPLYWSPGRRDHSTSQFDAGNSRVGVGMAHRGYVEVPSHVDGQEARSYDTRDERSSWANISRGGGRGGGFSRGRGRRQNHHGGRGEDDEEERSGAGAPASFTLAAFL
jgi:hypothetical protein